jgi:hypothetical protein
VTPRLIDSFGSWVCLSLDVPETCDRCSKPSWIVWQTRFGDRLCHECMTADDFDELTARPELRSLTPEQLQGYWNLRESAVPHETALKIVRLRDTDNGRAKPEDVRGGEIQ